MLTARGVDRALVVGWSYEAFVAAHWASHNPDRAVGAILVEGTQPYDWLTEDLEQGTSAPSPMPYVRSPPSTAASTEEHG